MMPSLAYGSRCGSRRALPHSIKPGRESAGRPEGTQAPTQSSKQQMDKGPTQHRDEADWHAGLHRSFVAGNPTRQQLIATFGGETTRRATSCSPGRSPRSSTGNSKLLRTSSPRTGPPGAQGPRLQRVPHGILVVSRSLRASRTETTAGSSTRPAEHRPQLHVPAPRGPLRAGRCESCAPGQASVSPADAGHQVAAQAPTWPRRPHQGPAAIHT